MIFLLAKIFRPAADSRVKRGQADQIRHVETPDGLRTAPVIPGSSRTALLHLHLTDYLFEFRQQDVFFQQAPVQDRLDTAIEF